MGLTKPIEQNILSYQGTFMYLKILYEEGNAMGKIVVVAVVAVVAVAAGVAVKKRKK